MKTKELDRLSKQELLKLLNEISGKIDKLKTEKPSSKKLPRMLTQKRRIKRVLYECVYCADAQIMTMTDKHGNEKDFLRKDCGLAECPYHEYFINKTKDEEAKMKKLLKIFFKNA